MFTFLYPSFLSLIQQILEYFETIPLNQQPLNSLFVNFFSQILYFFATSMNYKMDSVVPLLILQVKDIGRFPPFSILLKSFHFSFKSNGFQHLLASYDEPFSVVFSNTNIPCHTSSPRQDLTNPRAGIAVCRSKLSLNASNLVAVELLVPTEILFAYASHPGRFRKFRERQLQGKCGNCCSSKASETLKPWHSVKRV
jgi:hypothetical protein